MRRYSLARLVFAAGAVLALVLAPAGLAAQTIVLDEGIYRLTIGGREVGTERFMIRQNGRGANASIVAQGRVVLDAADEPERVEAVLEVAESTLRPVRYRVRIEGDAPQSITGRVVNGRFSAKIVSSAGEMMREYLASRGAVLVDQGVAHQYYFLARSIDGRSSFDIPVIIPRRNRQVSTHVTVTGAEPVAVAGQRVRARHLVVEPEGLPTREVWIDDEGRVLRLEVPARNYVAVRTGLPG